jgi:hypothetical protein
MSKDVTDEEAVAAFIGKYTSTFTRTMRSMHKTYKCNKQGVRSAKAGTKLIPFDCPLKAPQITFQWGKITRRPIFSKGDLNRMKPPPYWSLEEVLESQLVVSVKWERQVRWEFDQITHKEQETALFCNGG